MPHQLCQDRLSLDLGACETRQGLEKYRGETWETVENQMRSAENIYQIGTTERRF